MKILILGVGNPIVGDDGVGFYIVQELSKKVKDKNVDIKDASTSGFNLLELIVGYDKVIIVDAIKTKNGQIGKIHRLKPEDFKEAFHLTSVHDINLVTAIEIGNELIEKIPKEIVIFAVEIKEASNFSEKMTEKVKKAIPKAVDLVLSEMAQS